MQGLNYKILPISDDVLKAARTGSPEIYGEMIAKYGKDKVTNNFLIDVVVLQEARAIYAAGGRKIDITKSLIELTYAATMKKFNKWYHAPINKLKQWVRSSDYLGYIPVQVNHSEDLQNRHGYYVGGSFKLVEVQGKLCMCAKAVLISPESKYNYAMGLWNTVSPGINQNYEIDEISFVTIPADINNSTLSDGTPGLSQDIIPVEVTSVMGDEVVINKDFDAQLKELKQKAIDEKLHNEIKSQEYMVGQTVETMILKGVIPSSKRKTTQRALLRFSSGQLPLAAELLEKTNEGTTPLTNKPKTFLLKGTVDMLTKEERYAKWSKDNAQHFKDANEALAAFAKDDAKHLETLRLSTGVAGMEAMGKDKYNEFITMLSEDEAIDEETKKKILEACSTKFGIKLEQGAGIDAGGVGQPNTSSDIKTDLKTGTPGLNEENQNKYNEVLQEGYDLMKAKNETLEAQVKEYEIKVANLKKAIEV